MPRARHFLWWLAVLIVATGTSFAWLMYPHIGLQYSHAQFNLIIAATVVLAGICLIAATADWWLRR